MSRVWKSKGCNPDLLIAQVEKERVARSEFPSARRLSSYLKTYIHCLSGCIRLPEGMPERDAVGSIEAALEMEWGGRLTREGLGDAIQRQLISWSRRACGDYQVACHLSVAPNPRLRGASWGDCRIRFMKRFPRKRFDKSVDFYARLHDLPRPPEDYARVLVEVSARSDYQAWETASSALDLIRGIWNLSLNQDHKRPQPLPVNQIRLGPIQTVHRPDGTVAEIHSYSTNYRRTASLRPDSRWDHLRDQDRHARRALERSNYRSDLENVIVRYARALDEQTAEISLLLLWGIVELLTGSQRVRVDKIQQRLSFLAGDPDLEKEILRWVAKGRHRFAHAGKESAAEGVFVFEARSFVERLLQFHFIESAVSPSLAEAAKLLDSPTDSGMIRRQMGVLKRAKRYRRGV